MSHDANLHRLRSFVIRNSRKTPAQARALAELWPLFGLSPENGLIDMAQIFGRTAPTLLEIGFGSGQTLLALAKAHPEKNFIGIETHEPGIGTLCLGMKQHALCNLRVYQCDAIDVFEQCLPSQSIDGIQIFFPDPWPKRRHHPRRLIQSTFTALLVEKLTIGGSLHLATDWEDYAQHMMRILSQEKNLINLSGPYHYAPRSIYRPVMTKFEQRAQREGRSVWELQFEKRR